MTTPLTSPSLNPAFPIYGADTSAWSQAVDFDRYKSAGCTFVINKGSQGKMVDPYFITNYTRARTAGVYVSSYHLLLPAGQVAIADQVNLYAELVANYPHDFVPWVDYEGSTGAPVTADLVAFVDGFEQKTGREIGLYSAQWKLAMANSALPTRLGAMKFWVAHYTTTVTGPRLCLPLRQWHFWQWTDSFPADNLGFPATGERAVDLNYFNGSLDMFLAFCGRPTAPTEAEQMQQRALWQVPAPPLVKDNTGMPVQRLQEILLRQSFLTPIDQASGPGMFGPRTFTALSNMQTALRITASGIYDDKTRDAVITQYYGVTPPDLPPAPPPAGPADTVLEERSYFSGHAQYKRYRANVERGAVQYHVLRVDLSNSNIMVSPKPSKLTFVHSFLAQYGMDVAINGDGWSWPRRLGFPYLQTSGFNASRKQVYGPQGTEQTLYIDKSDRASLRRPTASQGGVWHALSFPNLLVNKGVMANGLTTIATDARMSLGFTQDNHYAIIIAVDGVPNPDAAHRTGMTLSELATRMLAQGAWIGANLNGGASATLVIRDETDRKPRILNNPCGGQSVTVGGSEFKLDKVANHFGIKLTP